MNKIIMKYMRFSMEHAGGGGGGNLGIILVRVCEPFFFKPIIYLVFENNDLFICLIEQNVFSYSYTVL